MKKIFFAFIICSFITQNAFAQSAEIILVKEFMDYSLNETRGTDWSKKRKALIAPAYIKSKNASAEDVKPNSYGYVDYMIVEQNNRDVKVLIWGKEKKWVHELVFRISTENGRDYILPDPNTEISKNNYFNPWMNIKQYVTVDKTSLRGVGHIVLSKNDVQPDNKSKVQPVKKVVEKSNAAVALMVVGVTNAKAREAMKKNGYYLLESKAVELDAVALLHECKPFLKNRKYKIFLVVESMEGVPVVRVNSLPSPKFFGKGDAVTKGTDKCMVYSTEYFSGDFNRYLKINFSRPAKAYIIIHEKRN